MRCTGPSILLLALVLLSGPAAADDPAPADPPVESPAKDPTAPADKTALFERLDVNKDGAVQLDELPPELQSRLKPLFARLNKTSITAAELSAVSDRPADTGGARGRLVYFATLDANGNGELTVDEVPEAAKLLVTALLDRAGKKPTDVLTRAEYQRFVSTTDTVPTRPATDAGPGLMKTLDADGDGKLSRSELAVAAAKFDTLDADGSGDLDPAELLGTPNEGSTTEDARSEVLVRRIFDDLDVNHDGAVDRTEAGREGAERLADNFERIDADMNDRIDFAEFSKSITRPATTPADDAPE